MCSAFTANQTLAFLSTLFILVLLLLGSAMLPNLAPAGWRPVLAFLSFDARIQDFAKGVIDPRHAVYFVGASIPPLLFASVALRARRLA
jgi:hypothetical protein